MRKSRYTVEARSHAGEPLLFNTANGAFAVLDGESFANYQAEKDPTGALADAGFLTEKSPEEELRAQQELFSRQRADLSRLVLSFVPTYVCNYRCPYCYEQGHNKVPGFMSDDAMDAVENFVRVRFAAHPFEKLEVQWYGGDPSLCLDVVEKLSGKLRAFCVEAGAAYDAMMLSNCNTVDEDAAKLIADCGVTSMLLTIDGPKEHHNKRRVAANGTDSYERVLRAARAFRKLGVSCSATMNVDKVTLPLARAFADKMLAEEGISVVPGQLNDYGHNFGTGDFCPPEFDLYTHDEYARARFELFDKGHLSAADLREMLRPTTHFCNGQRDNYFIIDLLGDVYACDGYVGEKECVKFNLFDDESAWQSSFITHDATTDPACMDCTLLPICQGSCRWERECAKLETGELPCHPLKQMLGDYLAEYRDCLNAPASGVTLLASPFTREAIERQG